MAIEWGADDFDWRDVSLDESLARAWLRNERLWRLPGQVGNGRVPDGYNREVDGWARELVMTDLDPERGWQLVIAMVLLAEDDEDLRQIGDGPLYLLVRNHAEILPRVRERAADDPRLQRALRATDSWGSGGKDQRDRA